MYSHLIGKPVADVVKELETEFAGKVVPVEVGMVVTADFRMDRLRVWYDHKTGTVKEIING